MADLQIAAPLVVAIALGIAATAGVISAQRWRRRRGVRSRLAMLNLSVQPAPGRNRPQRFPFRSTVRSGATQLGQCLVNRSSASLEQRSRLIDGSGLGGRLSPAELFGWQFVLGVAGLLIGLAAIAARPIEGLLAMPALAACGFIMPTLWLQQRQNRRCQELLRDLPTVIDLLALSLAAGMGLDRALSTVCERVPSAVSDELHHVLNDISLGISREEAFVRLAERAPYEDIRSLTRAITQSEQLGTSLISTVQTQARHLRVVRQRRAEAQALRAPIKMLIPMVLFILPTLFLVVLGPPFLRLSEALAQGQP